MRIDLSCPVELVQSQTPTEEQSQCFFVLNNLSPKTLVSVQLTMECFGENDTPLFEQTERIQGIRAESGASFSVGIEPNRWNDVHSMNVIIEKAWFDDASVWRKGKTGLVSYESNALPTGRALDDLRFVAGNDAAGYPVFRDTVWLCVCGRPNALDSDTCCRCRRRRDSVFASFSEKNVRRLVDANEKMLQDASHKVHEENSALQEKQEIRNAAIRMRRKKILRRVLLGLVLCVAVAAFFVWGWPAVRYTVAKNKLESGKANDAKAIFLDLKDYRDASGFAVECDYRQACTLLESEDEASLRTAKSMLTALGEYSDAAEKLKLADYRLAKALLENGSYEEADDLLAGLDDYGDSRELRKEAIYRKAYSREGDGRYEEARSLFLSLGDYSDAAARAKACSYSLACEELNTAQFDQAETEFKALGDYEDAPTLLLRTYYEWAEEKEAEAQYEEAGQLFLLAGDYQDGRERGNECLYQLAMQKKAEGDYAEARRVLLSIAPYSDSEAQAGECLYLQALLLKNNGDREGVLALLENETLTDELEELANECRYALAVEARETGDNALAENFFSACGEYADSPKQLKIARYAAACADMDAGNYAAAAERFSLLGNYKKSSANLRACLYAMAESFMESGDYAAAAELYQQLSSYKKSRSKYAAARIAQAQSLCDAADWDGALAALEGVTGSNANELRNTILLNKGASLEAQGLCEEALLLYASADSEEAAQRANACRYQLAEQALTDGNLLSAAEQFAALGSYQDAESRSTACFEEVYGETVQTARNAMENQDYVGVIAALYPADWTFLPKEYQDLPQLYAQACFLQAESLYEQDKPYEALPYYQLAGTWNDADIKLTRKAYLILGKWTGATGNTVEFRTDGTCNLMGEELFFRVNNYNLLTGSDAQSLSATHKLTTLRINSLTLRDVRNGEDHVYNFTRDGEYTLPEFVLPEEVALRMHAGASSAEESHAAQ